MTILLNSKRGIYAYKAVQCPTNLCKYIRENILLIPLHKYLGCENDVLENCYINFPFFKYCIKSHEQISFYKFPCLDILEKNHLSFSLHIPATNPVCCVFSWYSGGQTNGVCYRDKMVHLEQVYQLWQLTAWHSVQHIWNEMFTEDTFSLRWIFWFWKSHSSISSPHFDVCAGTNISTSKYISNNSLSSESMTKHVTFVDVTSFLCTHPRF